MKTFLLATSLVSMTLHSVTTRHEEPRVAQSGSSPVDVTTAPYTVAVLNGKGVSLGKATLKSDRPICTGSIIDPEWVLTAAHCILNVNIPNAILIIAGTDAIQQYDEKFAQRREGKEVYQHPSYWKEKVSKYDVAVLRVDKFEFNERVGKVSLWAKDWAKAPPNAKYEWGWQKCEVFGWGSLELKVTSDVLRGATLYIRHGTEACPCMQMFQQRRLVCTQPGSVGGICPGDSGGPLVCNGTQVGVSHIIYHRKSCSVSYFGNIQLKCNDVNSISAWMYVCPMLDFISEHVTSVPSLPESCKSSQLICISLLHLAMLNIITTIKLS